jgi:hypothetical protein
MALHRKCELKKGHLYCFGSVKMVLAGHLAPDTVGDMEADKRLSKG